MLLFLAASCVREEVILGPKGGEDEDMKFLSFTIKSQPGGGGDISRATPSRSGTVPSDEEYNESVIDISATHKDIHLFFFEMDRQTCIFYPETERLQLIEPDDPAEKHIQVDLEADGGGAYEAFDPMRILGKNTYAYVVVNSGLPRSDFMSGSDVMTLDEIIETVITASFNEVEAGGSIVKQDKFVMDDMQQIYIGPWTNAATLNLSRVASKIQVGGYSATADGYTAVADEAEVKFVNFVNTSALGRYSTDAHERHTPAAHETSDYIPIALPAGGGGTIGDINYAEPFYSYPSDWSGDPDNEAYLLLKVNWYNSGAGETAAQARPYYYKIPINQILADNEAGAAFRDQLRRNYLYRYFVKLSELGSADPDVPAELTDVNLDIMGWGNEDIATSIQKFDWLFVEEQNVIIYPDPGVAVQEYLIPYRSNTTLTFPADGAVKATYGDYTGGNYVLRTITPVTYPANPTLAQITGQFPYVNANHVVGSQRYIRILTRVPINYVPKDIWFKVQNDAHLFAEVSIVHYPALYVTATTVGSNRSYTFTTLAITGTETFTSPNYSNFPTTKTYQIGSIFTKNGNNWELTSANNTAENAWVVSPKFTIESNPYTSTESKNNAWSRCRGTRDGQTGWRLPSMAEMYLIWKLQTNTNSAVNGAITGSWGAGRIWTAGNYLLHETGNQSNGTVFQVASSVAPNVVGDGTYARGALGIYLHTTTCVRDAYQ